MTLTCELPATAYVSSWGVLVLSKKISLGVLLILRSEPPQPLDVVLHEKTTSKVVGMGGSDNGVY